MLTLAGAKVTGYALNPPTFPSLFEIAEIKQDITSIIGDIRDISSLKKVFEFVQPEFVFHLAAQPIVRDSYKDPVYTYETNVMGTVNVLEAVRQCGSVKSFLNVTTDKVYKNLEWEWGYRENDVLDGYDPYSNSKSCSELVTSSYRKSFFMGRDVAISTCRAGNVIGGGDFAKDRIIPDCIRAQETGQEIIVRNPHSTRPYQHVLEPVCAYLKLAELQYFDRETYEGSYNVGPDDCDCVTTGELVELFCKCWGDRARWKDVSEPEAPHEAGFLKLDCSKIKRVMNWKPRWHVEEAVSYAAVFGRIYLAKGNLSEEMEREITEYLR